MSSYSSIHLSEPEEIHSLRHRQFRKSEVPMGPEIRRTVVDAGIGMWTPLWIIGGTVFAAGIAVAHHIVDTHFDNRMAEGFWTQDKTKPLEILLATAFKIVFCFSAGASLCQVAWYSMRRQPLSLADIDCLVGLPSIVTRPRIGLIWKAPATLMIATIILASPVISVFAPSLSVRQASSATRSLSVPTLNLITDGWFDDIALVGDSYSGPSSSWDKVVLESLTSAGPLGWTIPGGCAPECRYNITYYAPAIRCSELAPDQINDGGRSTVPRVFQDPPAAYLMGYDAEPAKAFTTGIVNFTAVNDPFDFTSSTDQYIWTLAYFPFVASNADEGALINAAGSMCTWYNATHAAQTHFVNGTQESSVSVVEFHDALNTTLRRPGHIFNEEANINLPVVGGPGVGFAPGLGGPLHFFAVADAISARLLGTITRDWSGNFVQQGPRNTASLILETTLFESPDSFNASTLQFTGLNISSSITNMSQGLENLVANITLGFVHLGTGFITVDALVASTHTVYHYTRATLVVTYLAAFGCLLAISALGMFCLVANGEPSSNSFSRLLMVTRNPKLDHVMIEASPGVSADDARLMFGAVDVPGQGVQAAFGLVSHQDVQKLRRRTQS
ncbi:hypothetical protein FB451DRAFT_1411041 [Mycena latifolia]|nr:hypothetical protein FB451DRAFT_1411041 [Mycena latifolia]